LAFEIEEALITNKTQASGRMKRHPDFIRRSELVVVEET
jgi:hypothetical protein